MLYGCLHLRRGFGGAQKFTVADSPPELYSLMPRHKSLREGERGQKEMKENERGKAKEANTI